MDTQDGIVLGAVVFRRGQPWIQGRVISRASGWVHVRWLDAYRLDSRHRPTALRRVCGPAEPAEVPARPA